MIETKRVVELANKAMQDISNKVKLGLLGCSANGTFVGTRPSAEYVATQHGLKGLEWKVFTGFYCTMAYHTLNDIKKEIDLIETEQEDLDFLDSLEMH